MNRPFDEEAAIATDTYIDLLLDRRPVVQATDAHALPLPDRLRTTIDVLHLGLPRLHPSFAFEEQLAARLRAASETRPRAQVIGLRVPRPSRSVLTSAGVDRRVLLGGAAIAASGFSMAAVFAWRQAARRARIARANRGVPA